MSRPSSGGLLPEEPLSLRAVCMVYTGLEKQGGKRVFMPGSRRAFFSYSATEEVHVFMPPPCWRIKDFIRAKNKTANASSRILFIYF